MRLEAQNRRTSGEGRARRLWSLPWARAHRILTSLIQHRLQMCHHTHIGEVLFRVNSPYDILVKVSKSFFSSLLNRPACPPWFKWKAMPYRVPYKHYQFKAPSMSQTPSGNPTHFTFSGLFFKASLIMMQEQNIQYRKRHLEMIS